MKKILVRKTSLMTESEMRSILNKETLFKIEFIINVSSLNPDNDSLILKGLH